MLNRRPLFWTVLLLTLVAFDVWMILARKPDVMEQARREDVIAHR